MSGFYNHKHLQTHFNICMVSTRAHARIASAKAWPTVQSLIKDGAAPTTSECSTILLPTMVCLVLEVIWYVMCIIIQQSYNKASSSRMHIQKHNSGYASISRQLHTYDILQIQQHTNKKICITEAWEYTAHTIVSWPNPKQWVSVHAYTWRNTHRK